MNSAAHALTFQSKLRSQLMDRRSRLESTIADLGRPADLLRLLTEVDAALSRVDGDTYGGCTVCHGLVEETDLLANPMASYCLCPLTPERQRALERDLDLAWHVQAALLPPLGLSAAGWQTHYRYLPHGAVSGDYCDLVVSQNEAEPGLYFMLGDVSGKGVAASLLMAHLNALLRGFARSGIAPHQALSEANRLLAESTLASHYVTLVCGRARQSGELEIVNAGHCAPLVIRASGAVETLENAGLPLGLALAGATAHYPAEQVVLGKGDVLFLYTDGLTDAADPADQEYGEKRLARVLSSGTRHTPRELIARCLDDVTSFVQGEPLSDDLTILALARE